MKTLCINSASSFTAVALLNEENGHIKLLAEESWISKNDEAEKLMPEISKLLDTQKSSFNDIQKVVVVRGPGSFTGLRIGVCVANTIAYLTGAKLYSLTTFDYWHTITALPILVFAGKGGVYLSEKGNSEGQLIDLPEINQSLAAKNFAQYSGDITDDQKSVIDAQFIPTGFTFGQVMEKALCLAPLEKAKLVKPLYIKKPAITKSTKPTVCFT